MVQKMKFVLAMLSVMLFIIINSAQSATACECGSKTVTRSRTVTRARGEVRSTSKMCSECVTCSCCEEASSSITVSVEPTPIAVESAPVKAGCGPQYRVCAKDTRCIDRCSERQTVKVYDRETCCCVEVDICVPPCATKDPMCYAKRHGNVTTFRFPGHNVQVRFKGDTVVVDYDS